MFHSPLSIINSPIVTAIVLTHNGTTARLAVRCVRSLLQQSIANQMEIIIVENHGQDDSIGLLRNTFKEIPNVHIAETNTNLGYGKGNMEGIRLAKGKYILILNPDNELLPSSLEKMIEVLANDESIGIVAPMLSFSDGTVRDSARAFPSIVDLIIKRTPLRLIFRSRMGRYLQKNLRTDSMKDVDWVVGACLLIERSTFNSIGKFDPQFFLFFEDIDLCRRCWEAGKRVVYFPQVEVQDRKRRLSEMSAFAMPFKRAGRAHIASMLRYFWKWRGTPLPR